MIKSILLNNFFSYRNQTIELNPTNFMVGINGSGKSNLIKAFMLLKAALVEGGLQELIINRWGGFDAICYKGFELTYDDHFSVEFEFDNNALSDYGYKFREPVYYSMSVYKVASAQNYAIKEVLCTKVVTNYKYFWATAPFEEGEERFLLVDSDEKITDRKDLVERVNSKCSQSNCRINATEDNTFFMEQEVEAWILSQPDALAKVNVTMGLPVANITSVAKPSEKLAEIYKANRKIYNKTRMFSAHRFRKTERVLV